MFRYGLAELTGVSVMLGDFGAASVPCLAVGHFSVDGIAGDFHSTTGLR